MGWLPAAIAAGGALLGGAIGSKSNQKIADQNARLQKEFAQEGISWKVKDAKAAGIHPLYALGASTNAYSPSFIGGQNPMGSAISEASSHLAEGYAKSKAPPPGTPQGAIGRAQLRAINAQAQRDEAAAIRDLSAAKREQQMQNVSQDTAVYADRAVPGQVQAVPSQSVSASKKDAGTEAGSTPYFKKYNIRTGKDGTPYYVYGPAADNAAEAFENVGGLLMSLGRNSWEGVKIIGRKLGLTEAQTRRAYSAAKRKRKLTRRGSR